MTYDIIDNWNFAQEEMSKLSTEEDIFNFAIQVLDCLESKPKTLNTDIAKALVRFFNLLPENVIKPLWIRALEKKRINNCLFLVDKEMLPLIKKAFVK